MTAKDADHSKGRPMACREYRRMYGQEHRRIRSWGQTHREFDPLVRLPPVEKWPEPHQAAWARACFRAGPLDAPGLLAHLKPSSLDNARKGWARYLSYLDVSGGLNETESPEQCLTKDRFVGFLAAYRKRATAATVSRDVRALQRAIGAMAPDQDWSYIVRHPAVPRRAEAQASKKRIVPPDPAALLMNALDFCDEVDRLPNGVRNSVSFRDGLIIALSTIFAVRRQNIAEILIGSHIVTEHETMRLVFWDSVKNGEHIDSIVPESLVPYVERYQLRHRSILLGDYPDIANFWISKDGRPLTYSGLFFVFQRMGKRLIGRAINVHSVRYAAATTSMDENPHNLTMAAALLAHRGTSSVVHIYDKSGHTRADGVWAKIRKKWPGG